MSPSIPDTNKSSTIWPTYREVKPNHINEKRLASLKRKNLETNERKQQIQAALKINDFSPNIVASTLQRKHIIFKDEEIENESHNVQKSDANKKNNSSPIKKKLFLEDDEPRSKAESQMLFKPQFEGKKGEKLLNLSLKIGHDQRFVLNENFVDSGESDYDEGEEINETEGANHLQDTQIDQDDICIDEEMDIYERALQSATTKLYERGESPKNLEDIEDYIPPIEQKYRKLSLNKEVNEIPRFFKDVPAPKSAGNVKSCSAIIERFDPTRADHVERFEIKTQAPVKMTESVPKEKKKKLVKCETKSQETKVESDEKKYYTVYRDLKGAFGNTSNSSSFTILKPPSDKLAVSDVPEVTQTPVENVKPKSFNKALESHFCEEDRFITLPVKAEEDLKITSSKGQYNFFIAPSVFEDPTSNLNMSVSNFCQRLAANADPEAWERKRAELSHLFKTKRKRYVRHKSLLSRRPTAFGKRN